MKSYFLPVKKTKKLPVKKKIVGVKNLKNGPKSGREKRKVPVKKIKKIPKTVFTGTFFFHGEKKNTDLAGVGVKNIGRGNYPAGVEVENNSGVIYPAGVEVKKCFRGFYPAWVGV